MTGAVHVEECAWAGFADPGDASLYTPGRDLRQWVQSIGADVEEGGERSRPAGEVHSGGDR